MSSENQISSGEVGPVALPAKSKTAAILLAVFLAWWTWLYTYKRDATKFWIALVVTILTIGFGGIVFWVWAIIDTCTKTDAWYANYPNG